MFNSKLVTSNIIHVVFNGEHLSFDNTHHNFKFIKEAVLNNDTETFASLLKDNVPLSPLKNIPNVVIEDNVVKYKGRELSNELAQDILDIYSEGYEVDYLVNFLENLMQNPSRRAVEEAYKFLKSLGLSITPDGHFLAYKCVRDDYLDKYSGKFSNHVGAVLEMERNQVDDNCNQTCSYGFHVGNLSYSGPGGSYYGPNDKVLIVKVNPRDIVSVPTDYDCGKCRVCRYEVIGDYKQPLTNSVYSGVVGDNKPVKRELDVEDMVVGNVYVLELLDETVLKVLVDTVKDSGVLVDVLDDGNGYEFIDFSDIYAVYNEE